MPKYVVTIDASNFLVEMDNQLAKRGFIALKLVEADDPKKAEFAAVQMLRDDQGLREMVRNEPNDPPVMDLEEIAEVDSFDSFPTQPGLIWYELNPKRWWQFWRR